MWNRKKPGLCLGFCGFGLQRLREAEERKLEADSRERIKRAIKVHENRIAELEALLTRGAESIAS